MSKFLKYHKCAYRDIILILSIVNMTMSDFSWNNQNEQKSHRFKLWEDSDPYLE